MSSDYHVQHILFHCRESAYGKNLLPKPRVIYNALDSWFEKHTDAKNTANCWLMLANPQKKKKKHETKNNMKWVSLGWVIPDLPLKWMGADALCQLMFRVTPVSLKDSLMRHRQAHCAQSSGDGNPKESTTAREHWCKKKQNRIKGETDLQGFQRVLRGERMMEIGACFLLMVTESCDAAHHSKCLPLRAARDVEMGEEEFERINRTCPVSLLVQP